MDKISVKFQTYFKDNTEKIQYFDQAISTFCKTIQEYQEELDERTNINSQFNNEENYINDNEAEL